MLFRIVPFLCKKNIITILIRILLIDGGLCGFFFPFSILIVHFKIRELKSSFNLKPRSESNRL